MDLKDVKAWDKVLAPLVSLGFGFILPAVGLDALFGWTLVLPLIVKLTALGLILLGYVFGSWALIENRFFSGVMYIQKQRGHHVVSTGPYRWVRHPGYVEYAQRTCYRLIPGIW